MSHETHHHHPVADKPTTSFKSAFWFVIILAGLFIAAVNFISAMSHDSEGHGEGHGATEMHQPNMEATHNQSLEGETGLGKPSEESVQHHGSNAGMDTTHMEGH